MCRILTIGNRRRQRDEQSSLTRTCLRSFYTTATAYTPLPEAHVYAPAQQSVHWRVAARPARAWHLADYPWSGFAKWVHPRSSIIACFRPKLPGADTLRQLEASSPPDLPRIALVIELFSYSDQKRTLQNWRVTDEFASNWGSFPWTISTDYIHRSSIQICHISATLQKQEQSSHSVE